MAQAVERSGILGDYPTIDGVIALVHGGGCALDVKGEGYDILKRTQWGYADEPEHRGRGHGGARLRGLPDRPLEGRLRHRRERHLPLLHHPGDGRHEKDRGGRRRSDQIDAARSRPRPSARRSPASELVLALQCGGSDGYSGITANAALGAAVDLLVRQGGTAILSETPEIYGAEHLLTRRAATRAVGEKLVERIKWWEDYTSRNRMEMNNNPSPGNKAGGLTTILEKSLGAAAKGGTTTLNAVYEYAEPVTEKGFVFMDTPGYDPVSATGQVAGGANILAFTTGRGSAYGCKPTPSIKLATNSEMYRRMIDDMDIDCGDIVDGVPVARPRARRFSIRSSRSPPASAQQIRGARLWRRRIRALDGRRDDVSVEPVANGE